MGRIAVTFHDGSLNGATLSVLRVVPVMESRGWEFSFWVDRPSPVYDWLRERGYDVDGTRRHLGFSLYALRHPPGVRARLRSAPDWLAGWGRFVRSRRPVLAHCNTYFTLPEAAVARGLGRPALLHVHEMMRDNWKGRAIRLSLRASGIGAAGVSTAAVARIEDHGGPSTFLVHEAAPVPAAPAARAGDPPVFGTVGAITRRKGTDVFVAAAERVLEQRPDLELRLVGTVPDDPDHAWGESVLERARAAGITHIPWTDTLEEIAGWDGFVIASRYDPFPLVVLEAMGSALPVVGTRVDGIAEQVRHGRTGLLVAPEDDAGLAGAIVELAGDADRRRRLGDAGRRRLADHFTPEHQADELERAYGALLG